MSAPHDHELVAIHGRLCSMEERLKELERKFDALLKHFNLLAEEVPYHWRVTKP